MRLDPSLASDLIFFRVAAATRSFVKASERLSVTQSAVSQRILRLEARLGVDLFLRQKSGLSLTSAGEILFSTVRSAFDSIDETLGAVRNLDTSRPAIVSCSSALAVEWLVPRLVNFYRLHPDIDVSVVGEMDIGDVDGGDRPAFDIAVQFGPDPPAFGEVVFAVPEQVFPVLSPRLNRQMRDNPDSSVTLLHDAHCWANAAGARAEWTAWLNLSGELPFPNPTRDTFLDQAQLCYRAAADGLGIALGRRLIIRRHLAEGELVSLRGARTLEQLRYFVVTWPGHRPRQIQIVLDWLVAQMAEELLITR